MNTTLATRGGLAESSAPATSPKVLYITAETPYGAGEVWALDEMLALLESGCDLRIAPRSATGKAFHPKAAPVLARTVSVPLVNSRILFSLAGSVMRQPGAFGDALRWIKRKSIDRTELAKSLAVMPKALELARLLRHSGVQHIHAHSTSTVAVLAWLVARELRCPFSFTLHTTVLLDDSLFPSNLMRRQLQTLLDSAAFVRTISATIAKRLTAFLGPRYASKIVFIPLGVDCEVRRVEPAKKDRFTLLTPAVLRPYKGHRVAIEACRILKNRGFTGFRWLFFGDGPLREELDRQIRAQRLSDIIFLGGNVANDRILELYSRGEVDATVLPSVVVDGVCEGIPHALMQAMSYRVPVVATDSGDTLELIGDGAGIFVPQKDPTALADAIVRLINDEALCRRQGEEGYEKVSRVFNKRETVRALTELFSKVSP